MSARRLLFFFLIGWGGLLTPVVRAEPPSLTVGQFTDPGTLETWLGALRAPRTDGVLMTIRYGRQAQNLFAVVSLEYLRRAGVNQVSENIEGLTARPPMARVGQKLENLRNQVDQGSVVELAELNKKDGGKELLLSRFKLQEPLLVSANSWDLVLVPLPSRKMSARGEMPSK